MEGGGLDPIVRRPPPTARGCGWSGFRQPRSEAMCWYDEAAFWRDSPGLAGAGYTIVPFGQGNIDYTTFFQRIGAKGYHNSMYEQDNAASVPAPATATRSLENAASSYASLASLRG